MSWSARTLLAAGSAAAAYAGISALMARGLTRSVRIIPDDTPAVVGLPYETISFPSRAGDVELSGWLCPPPGCSDMNDALAQRWIVLVHGFGSHSADAATGIIALARDLHDRNFGVLLFDSRASGRSEGERGSSGFFERLDLLGAIDHLAHRGVELNRIGVLGQSLGGAVALMACSSPGTVAAVVADSAFADLELMIRRAQSGAFKTLRLFNPGMRFMARALYGIDSRDVSPARSLAMSEAPALIIHGEDDRVVPVSHSRLLARAAGLDRHASRDETASRLWIAPGVGHVQAYKNSPTEYVEKVSSFFDAHLGSGIRVAAGS